MSSLSRSTTRFFFSESPATALDLLLRHPTTRRSRLFFRVRNFLRLPPPNGDRRGRFFSSFPQQRLLSFSWVDWLSFFRVLLPFFSLCHAAPLPSPPVPEGRAFGPSTCTWIKSRLVEAFSPFFYFPFLGILFLLVSCFSDSEG